MSLQVYSYEELKERNSFIEKDLERVNTKAKKLNELLFGYIREKKQEYKDIQESLHTINNTLAFSDDDLRQLLDIENDIDNLIQEIKK